VADLDTTLAMMQVFLPHATDGWKLALTSVRDLFAEADLHADEVGGDFASEAERIGRVTAEVHDALAQVLDTSIDGSAEIAATVQSMHERLHDAVAEVAELAPFADALHAVFDAVPAAASKVPVQRIHGDLHLGQLLRTDTGWNLVDFEGEPARPLSDRTRLMTPLRDVAGMLRSFDYAARSLLADHPGDRSLAFRAQEWADRNRASFCDGYAAVTGADPRDSSALLNACEIDKAVYEVLYEVHHRPSWAAIPLAGLARITGREETTM
jgi:maltokinase